MKLENLDGKSLESVVPDQAAIGRLLEASRSSLADARLAGLSDESRFNLA